MKTRNLSRETKKKGKYKQTLKSIFKQNVAMLQLNKSLLRCDVVFEVKTNKSDSLFQILSLFIYTNKQS